MRDAIFVASSGLVEQVLSILQQPPPLAPVLAGYCSKVMVALFKAAPEAVSRGRFRSGARIGAGRPVKGLGMGERVWGVVGVGAAGGGGRLAGALRARHLMMEFEGCGHRVWLRVG